MWPTGCQLPCRCRAFDTGYYRTNSRKFGWGNGSTTGRRLPRAFLQRIHSMILKQFGKEKKKKILEYSPLSISPTPVYYKEELEKLKEANIPVHSFYINSGAEATFTEIASVTGGECGPLDVNSPAGAERLTQVITERILENLGGEMGAQLVDDYRAHFCKGYTA
eukprot:Lithocolla_globosa_v1_NODE_1296_length_2695_cov_5.603638.p2 type:complete len:165 gc:universal NODE_1296_length_2695_cov_5.603638:543-49(-)